MVHIREARRDDAAGIARVHVESWRTTYRGILPDDYLASLSYADREALWGRWLDAAAAGARAVFVAEDIAAESAPAGTSDAPPGQTAPANSPANSPIVGFASGGRPGRDVTDFDGELYMVYLLQSHQRRGVGKALFRRVVDWLIQDGRQSLFVWVARDNPSRAFYEAMGGRLVRERRAELFGQQIDEVAYGWDDIAALATQLGSHAA